MQPDRRDVANAHIGLPAMAVPNQRHGRRHAHDEPRNSGGVILSLDVQAHTTQGPWPKIFSHLFGKNGTPFALYFDKQPVHAEPEERCPMKKKVVVLDPDDCHRDTLCSILKIEGYQVFARQTLKKMEACIHANDCTVAMIDIDTIAIDSRIIRDLTIKYPGVFFLCLSEGRFHPELKEALRNHIYACINKPVDPSEIHFWLRSIFGDNLV